MPSSRYTREHIRELIEGIPGSKRWVSEGSTPMELYISDAEDLVEMVLRVANRSYAEGMRLGQEDRADA